MRLLLLYAEYNSVTIFFITDTLLSICVCVNIATLFLKKKRKRKKSPVKAFFLTPQIGKS